MRRGWRDIRPQGRSKKNDYLVVWRGLRVAVCHLVSEMTPAEQVQFARYKEATLRADSTITAQRKTIAALNVTLQTQRHLIDLLNEQVRKTEGQMEELRAAL